MLENLADPERISVSCHKKLLTNIVCVMEDNDISSNQMTNAPQTFKPVTLTTFVCSNKEYISSTKHCDGVKDCRDGMMRNTVFVILMEEYS